MRYFVFFFLSIFSFPVLGQTDRNPLFKSFDGTLIHYDTTGNGKPVILVHGFIGNGNMWKKAVVVPELVKAGYKVIIIDLRGNGRSDKPQELKSYQNDAEVKDIMALMKFLGYKKYDVVGYSRGAILTARELVIDKHINAAVIGGMGTDFTNPNWARRKMFEEAFSGKAHLYPETHGAINYAKSIHADTLVLGYLQHVQPSTSVAELSKIKNPVLIISGDQDEDNGKAGDLAKLLPNSILKTVPGNHNNASQSQEFANEIVAFLKEHQH